MPEPADLEARIGHRFVRRDLLTRALLHASAAPAGDRGNERLEFLGDRVLGLVVAERLVARFPDEREGDLARRQAYLVSEPVLAELAVELGLGPHIVFDKGERDSGGEANPGILADALEALIAALYLDAGIDGARSFVLACWNTRIDATPTPQQDPKTALQEWVLGRGQGLPAYRLESTEGPPHEPRFEVSVQLADGRSARGSGKSKRLAEKAAAAALMKQLEGSPRG